MSKLDKLIKSVRCKDIHHIYAWLCCQHNDFNVAEKVSIYGNNNSTRKSTVIDKITIHLNVWNAGNSNVFFRGNKIILNYHGSMTELDFVHPDSVTAEYHFQLSTLENIDITISELKCLMRISKLVTTR